MNPTGLLADTRGRTLRDLRISVTDRCNFRCVYCMPKEVFGRDYPFLPHAELLSFEEIVRLARIFKAHGIEKIRLTGGEPLLRKHLERLVAMLSDIGGLDAHPDHQRRAAGEKGARAQGRRAQPRDGEPRRARRRRLPRDERRRFSGLARARWHRRRGGRGPDADQDQHGGEARRERRRKSCRWRGTFRNSGHILRFIEYMDVGHTNGWRMDDVVPSAEVVRIIGREFPLEPVDANYPGEVAERWRYLDAKDGARNAAKHGDGEIGVISSVTQAFCSDCTRARLATDGKLYTCLFATPGYDMRALMRAGSSDDDIANYIAAIWSQRGDRYSEIRSERTKALPKVEMSYIGG